MTTAQPTQPLPLAPHPIRVAVEAMPVQDALAQADLRFGDREIDDAAAVAIASVFAADHRPALTGLAAGETVLAEDVLDDVMDARRHTSRETRRRALDMLGTYVLDAIRTGRIDA